MPNVALSQIDHDRGPHPLGTETKSVQRLASVQKSALGKPKPCSRGTVHNLSCSQYESNTTDIRAYSSLYGIVVIDHLDADWLLGLRLRDFH